MKSVGIQRIVTSAFSLVASIMIIVVSLVMFQLFSRQIVAQKTENAEQFLNQTKHGLEDYLRSNRRVSDALYYTCIKNKNVGKDSMDDELNLIYEANKDNILRIALYSEQGNQIGEVPVSLKENQEDIVNSEWFQNASNEVENLHFTMPYVENISDDATDGYRWVISLSRAVEINSESAPEMGVLVMDLKYSVIQQMIDKVNSNDTEEYIYLCDGDGNIIYHPMQLWMNSGRYKEVTIGDAIRNDGARRTKIKGQEYILVTKTVSYTGWKLVSAVPIGGIDVSQDKFVFILVFFIAIAILSMLVINQNISRSITRPLISLDDAIHDVEKGDSSPNLNVGGPREVVHLGQTLERYMERNQQLMEEVVEEQEQKRQSELDALQSQINPHFLYNTLDSVIWMIEDEQNDGAVYMIKELSKLLRISINKGRSMITVRDEIRHAKSYINIQQVRYKNEFSCEFDIEDQILDCCTIKLIVQPLLENAINHGVQGMGDDGEIMVHGYRKDSFIYIDVTDNGFGMTKEQIQMIFQEKEKTDSDPDLPARKGNGVGLKNVNSRIKMQFGEEYGVEIFSERGEGTTMRLKLPYLDYQDMMKKTGAKEGRIL